MRPLFLLPFALLAGCAGNVADYVGPRIDIMAPQLARYGLDEEHARCVAGRLGAGLTPLQLRRFERIASSVRQGYFDPARLTLRDLLHVASSMSDPQVRLELTSATEGCGVGTESIAAVEAESAGPGASGATDSAATEARPGAWLNLGAAPTGQAIAVDASSLEQVATTRKAWFRLTNPGAVQTGITYLLRIDCAARTIQPLADRRADAAGTVTEHHEYPPDEGGPMPIEGGTVMEIAYLALCT